jgi:mono/diheme cytochrome c family protein
MPGALRVIETHRALTFDSRRSASKKDNMVKRRKNIGTAMLLAAVLCSHATAVPPVHAAETATPTSPPNQAEQLARGKTLFITYGCGWCHEDGGRKAGRCPQLMGIEHDDNFIVSRIAAGSPGKMPAFGEALTGDDINTLLLYIRSLKPGNNP